MQLPPQASTRRALFVSAAVVLLCACGGGGGSSVTTGPVPTPTPTPVPASTPGPATASATTSVATNSSPAPVTLTVPAAGWQSGGTITIGSVAVTSPSGAVAVTTTAATDPAPPLPRTALNGTVLAYVSTQVPSDASFTGLQLTGGQGSSVAPKRTPGWTVDVDLGVGPQFASQSCIAGVADPVFPGIDYTDAVGGPAPMASGRCKLTIPYESTWTVGNGNGVAKLGYVILAVPAGSQAPATPGPVTLTPPSAPLPPAGSDLTIRVDQQGYPGPYQTWFITSGCRMNQFQPTADPHTFVIHGPGAVGQGFCERFGGASGWYADW